MENLLNSIKTALSNVAKWFTDLPKRTQITSIAISLGLILVILVSLLASTNSNKKFVGTWDEINSYGDRVSDGETLIFANDGTGSVKSDGLSGSLKWSVEKDRLFMTVSLCGVTDTYEFTYEFSGNTMTLTDMDGEKTVYRKR